MKKLSELLGSTAQKYSLDADATAAQVLFAAEEYLRAIFGEENVGAGKKIAGAKLQQGLLFFVVASAAWNNRLHMEKMDLLQHLQNKFPKLTLKDVRGMVQGGK